MSVPGDSQTLTPAAGPGQLPGRRRWRLTAAALAAAVLAAAALFGWYLRLSQTGPVNSDGAGNALQAWGMLHGNPLLHGWLLTDVSFYTTELPQYLLLEAAGGLTAGVVHVAAALTYMLLVILAALLARGRAGMALAAGLMLAPQLGPGVNILLSSPDHLGTAVPVLAAWLVVDRCPERLAAPGAGLLLAVAQLADPLTFWIGVLPLAAVCAVRLARRRASPPRQCPGRSPGRSELGLAAAALAGWAVPAVALRLITALGGFTAAPVSMHAVRPSHLLTNLQLTGRGLLLLFGADLPDAGTGLPLLAAAAHLAGVLAAGWAVWLAARHFRRQDLVVQVLLLAMAVDLAAYVASNRVAGLPATRDIDVLLPFGAALAGRVLGPRLAGSRWQSGWPSRRLVHWQTWRPAAAAAAAALVLAGCLPGLAALGTPAAAPQNHRLGRWLAARHLTSGLSGYWEANVVSLDTGGRVRIRAIRVTGGRVGRGDWGTDTAWYNPRRAAANYVVLSRGTPGYPGFTARDAVLATFGQPAGSYRFRRYQVLVWHRNLLAQLRSPQFQNSQFQNSQFQNSKGSSMRSPARKPGSSSGSRPG